MRAHEYPDFPLMADKPEYKPKRNIEGKRGNVEVCPHCIMIGYCRIRVNEGRWVMCEIPDELDFMRLEADLLEVAA